MLWYVPWLVSSAVAGGAILLSYAVVLFDAFGAYPLPEAGTTDYLGSPYWLGLPRSTTGSLLVLQVVAGVGFVAWQVSLLVARPETGLLATSRGLVLATLAFLLPSIAWPYAAHRLLLDRTHLGWALGASGCLWAAAGGVCALVGGTFEDARASPVAVLGIVATGTVVVLCDGVGWSAVAIHTALYAER